MTLLGDRKGNRWYSSHGLTDGKHLLNEIEAGVMVRVKTQIDSCPAFDETLKVQLKQCPVSLLVVQLMRQFDDNMKCGYNDNA